jgi:hypothetical protein
VRRTQDRSVAVVTHAQSKLLVVVVDLDLLLGMRVTEGVAQCFRRDPVDVVADDRVQIARLPFDSDPEDARPFGARVRGELERCRPLRR